MTGLSPTLLAEERQRTILNLLQKSGVVRTAALAELFNVSDQTIRRDFWELEKQGLVSKKHGGAVLLNYQSVPYGGRTELHQAAKLAIARAAALFVKPQMTVALGPGTTTEALARLLDSLELKIITNSLTVAEAVTHADTEVYLIGGRYRPGSELVTGGWAEANLRDFFADICFIGVSSIDLQDGYAVTEGDEAAVLRQFIRVSKTAIVISDSTKFGRTAQEVVAPLSAVHHLVTDDGISERIKQGLEAVGVEVVIAPSH
jgi:DeoR family transcriptional regulator of aga operon